MVQGEIIVNKDTNEPSDIHADISWRAVREEAGEVLKNLTDVRLRTIMTTNMAPAIYVFLCAGIIAVNLFLTVQAFQISLISGISWLLLIMPIGTIAGLIAVRVILESLLSLFRIVVMMETLMEQLHSLRGQTETIAERVEDLPLPRIQFWRPRKRVSDAKKSEGSHDSDER